MVTGNTAGTGANVFLTTDKNLTLSDAMADGANVGVTLGSDTGVAVTGYDSYHKDIDPTQFFTSDDDYPLAAEAGMVVLSEVAPDLDDTDDFIPLASQMASLGSVNSKNWLSGVSGERYLNEINIPGTHDSSMNRLRWFVLSSATTASDHAINAKTQRLYIDEQLDAGFRWIDLRLNNRYEISMLKTFTKERDDGKNLYVCHGTKWVGTIWAGNRNGDPLSLNEILGWVKDFLRKHPTEFIVISTTAETRKDEDKPTIRNRAKKIFRQLSQEINPSIGKSYVYMPNGFGKNFPMPQLKDVRGQVVLHSGDIFGGLNTSGYKRYAPAGAFKDNPNTRLRNILSFFDRYGGVELPKDAITHLDRSYRICTNSTDENGVFGMPLGTPLENAEIVMPAVFAEGGPMDQPGYLSGWTTMDGGTAREASMIWHTNFYDMDYVTVTVKPGLSALDLASGQYTESEGTTDTLSAQDETATAQASGQLPEDGQAEQEAGVKTYRLLRGTEITIPECIYAYEPAETGRKFQSWNATGETVNETHMPSETFIVMEDTTFTGQWLAEGETSVDIVWQDMDDMDSLRAESLELEVYPDDDPEHMYTQTLTAQEGWRAVLSGDVQKIVPVWERIDAEAEQGVDNAEGYRYEVTDAVSAQTETATDEAAEAERADSGLIVKLIHTPGGTMDASGAITWNDYDNRDGLRPDSVTIHLFSGEAEIHTQTVTAEDQWQYDIGELPVYGDGQKIDYRLTEDEIADYSMFVKDMQLTNTHTSKVVTLSGAIEWNDAGNAAGMRPESATVRLMTNGEEIASVVVTPEGGYNTVLEVSYEEAESIPDNNTEEMETITEGDSSGETVDEATDETHSGENETEDEGMVYVDTGDDSDGAENGESVEVPEDNGEAGWAFSFYGVPVNMNGQAVEYTIVEDMVEKYDSTVEYEGGYWITNTPLPEKVTLTYDANGGEGGMESVTVEPQSEYAVPECGFTAPEGMEFAGWTLTAEAPQNEEVETEADEPTVYLAGDVVSVTADATLTAQWQPIPQAIEIIFDANGGTGEMEAAEPDENGEYVLPESAFTPPEGVEFAGWKVAVEDTGDTEGDENEAAKPAIDTVRLYQPGDTITPDASVTAIAQWQEPAQPIMITFDANGGEGEMEAAQANEDNSYTLPESGFTAPEGMEFAGWVIKTAAPETDAAEAEAEAESSNALSAGDVIVVSAETTLVARWQAVEALGETEVPAAEAFSVTVTLQVVNGSWSDGTWEAKVITLTGSEGDELRLNVNDMPDVTAPDEGYGPGSWDVEPPIYSEEDGFTNGEQITEDATYTYTYAPIRAEASDEQPAVEQTGEGAEAESAGNSTARMVNVLFFENGGEGKMEGVEVEDQSEYILPENGYTAPEGMRFAGWLVGEEALQPGDTVTVTGDLLVMAQWEAAADAEEGEIEATAAESETETPAEAKREETSESEPVQATRENTEAEPKAAEEGEAKKASRSVMFFENGGEGEMESAIVEDQSQYVLPECGFTAPEGTSFVGWEIGDSTYKPGDTVTVKEDMLLIALWQSTESEQTETAPVEAETEQTETEAAPVEAETEQTETTPVEGEAVQTEVASVEEESAETETEAVPAEAEPAQTETETAPAEEESAQAETEIVSVEEKSAQTETEAEQDEPAPVEAEPEQTETEPAPVVLGPECTVRFESGGGEGEMKAVKSNEGAEYVLPGCDFRVEGCIFAYWEISGAGIEEPYTAYAGDTIVVSGDMTATALWFIDESYVPEEETAEAAEAEPEVEEAADGDMGNGFVFEYEEVAEEIADVYVNEEASVSDIDPMDNLPAEDGTIEAPAEAEAPSEVGSVFSGAGTAAIIAALVLALAAAGIAVTRKKKK